MPSREKLPKPSRKKLPAPRRDKHLAEMLDDDYGRSKRKETPNFYFKVYAIVEQIPRGNVTTYGAIAEAIGMKRSARMVGQALNAVPEGSGLPAQRVINRVGALSGAHHFGGYTRMRELLLKEGVTFKGDLVDMEKHFWKPVLGSTSSRSTSS